MLAEIDETDTLFSRQKLRPSGRIRVDMPHSLAREIVIPALPQFYQRYPEITLCLSANDASIDVLREGVDCVLRAWQVEDESLIARHLPALEQVTCASAEYIELYGIPNTLDDLATHQAVGYFSQRTTRHYPLDFMSQGGGEQRILTSQIDVSGADVYVAACRAGLGLIQSPRYGVRHWLESGELVEVLPEMPPPDMPLYIAKRLNFDYTIWTENKLSVSQPISLFLLFACAHLCSIGLRSGEYVGKYSTIYPASMMTC